MFKIVQMFAKLLFRKGKRVKSRSLILLSGLCQFGARAELLRTTKEKKKATLSHTQ